MKGPLSALSILLLLLLAAPSAATELSPSLVPQPAVVPDVTEPVAEELDCLPAGRIHTGRVAPAVRTEGVAAPIGPARRLDALTGLPACAPTEAVVTEVRSRPSVWRKACPGVREF